METPNKTRIRWGNQQWLTFSKALWALKDENLTVQEMVEDAMMHLPKAEQRPLHNNGNLYSIYNKAMKFAEKNILQMVSPEVAKEQRDDRREIRQFSKPAAKQVLEAFMMAQAAPTSSEKSRSMLTDHEILKAELAASLAEHKLYTLQSETRLLQAMDRMYIKLVELWLGEGSTTSLFSQDLQNLSAAKTITETSRDLNKEHVLLGTSSTPAKKTKKPEVLVFGLLPSQGANLQKRLPNVEIHTAKDIRKVRGNYSLVVISRFHTQEDMRYLETAYPGRCATVRAGTNAGIVEIIKNHLILA